MKHGGRVVVALTGVLAIIMGGCGEPAPTVFLASPPPATLSSTPPGTDQTSASTELVAESPSASDGADPPTASATGPTPASTPAPSVFRGVSRGTLRARVDQAFTSFYPWSERSTPGDTVAMRLQWDAIAVFDGEGTIQYRLAESITPSADAMVYTLKLREGVTWSDGTPFTADDILFTWRIAANPSQSSDDWFWAEVVGMTEWLAAGDFSAAVAGITAPDPLTVEIRLRSPNSAFLSSLLFRSYVLPRSQILAAAPNVHSLDRAQILAMPTWRTPDVAIGPYRWASTTVGGSLEFEANPTYWQGAPPFETVQLIAIEDAAAAAAQLRTGALDFAHVDIEDQPGLEAAGFPGGVGLAPFPIQTDFNNDSSYFRDVRVRQAFMHGCDRQGFVDRDLGGKGVKTDTYFFPSWVPKRGIVAYDFDLAGARELLDAAAADGAFDYARPAVWLSRNEDAPDRHSFIEACRATMSQIGVQITVVTGREATDPLLRAGNWDLQLYGGYEITDPDQLTRPFSCASTGTLRDPLLLDDYRRQLAPAGYAWGGSNYTNWCNEGFDVLMQEGRRLADVSARGEVYRRAQDIWLEDIPSQISYVNAHTFSWSANLDGVVELGDPAYWAWGVMSWNFTP